MTDIWVPRSLEINKISKVESCINTIVYYGDEKIYIVGSPEIVKCQVMQSRLNNRDYINVIETIAQLKDEDSQ